MWQKLQHSEQNNLWVDLFLMNHWNYHRIFKKINENVDDHEKEGDRGEWFLSEKKRRAALIPDATSSLLDQPSHHTIEKYMQYCMWNSETVK